MASKPKELEKLYADEVCRILHISKRKCAWMLQNGMIPCKDTGKKHIDTSSCAAILMHT